VKGPQLETKATEMGPRFEEDSGGGEEEEQEDGKEVRKDGECRQSGL